MARMLFCLAAASLASATQGAPAASSAGSPADPAQAAPTDPSPVTARWTSKKIDFVYMGFTTHYSCDGLLDTVRPVLLQLGARKEDLNVHMRGCTASLGRPDPFPGVAGTFSVLEPVATGAVPGGDANAAVAAHWHRIKVKVAIPSWDTLDTAGQCELIEQIKHHIVPLFVTRNITYRSNCIPHQLQLGTFLEADVLMPDAKSPGGPSAARNVPATAPRS